MSIPSISIHDVKECIDKDAESIVLLDVRTVGENASTKISDSVLIPLNELQGRVDELDRAKKIFIYCATGNRSQVACHILQQAGFENYLNVQGGIHAWQREGYDIVQNENKENSFATLFGF